jgi:hypothetical protein
VAPVQPPGSVITGPLRRAHAARKMTRIMRAWNAYAHEYIAIGMCNDSSQQRPMKALAERMLVRRARIAADAISTWRQATWHKQDRRRAYIQRKQEQRRMLAANATAEHRTAGALSDVETTESAGRSTPLTGSVTEASSQGVTAHAVHVSTAAAQCNLPGCHAETWDGRPGFCTRTHRDTLRVAWEKMRAPNAGGSQQRREAGHSATADGVLHARIYESPPREGSAQTGIAGRVVDDAQHAVSGTYEAPSTMSDAEVQSRGAISRRDMADDAQARAHAADGVAQDAEASDDAGSGATTDSMFSATNGTQPQIDTACARCLDVGAQMDSPMQTGDGSGIRVCCRCADILSGTPIGHHG